MQTVSRILQQISAQGFQLSPVRLTLFNYLSLFDSEDFFTHDTLLSFLQDCLDYPHWQQHRNEVTRELENILKELGEEELADPGEIHDFLDRQIFEVTHDRDFAEAVQSYMTHQLTGEGRQFRLFNDGNKKLIAICLKPDGQLEVRQFDRKFTIRHGQLTPVRGDLCLYYDAQLNLSETRHHKIEVAPYVLARFRVQDQFFFGKMVRGYIFQRLQELNGQPMEGNSRLFMSIKRLEQFFVRRESDPFYQKLVQLLERTIHLIRIGEPMAPAAIMETQVSVQNALEYVFTGDKLLSLLLKDLQNSMELVKDSPKLSRSELNLPKNLAGPNMVVGQRAGQRVGQNIGQETGQEIWQTQKPKTYQNPYQALKNHKLTHEFVSTNTSPTKALPHAEEPTKSLKKVESPSTAKKSTSLESKSAPRPIKSSSMVNP